MSSYFVIWFFPFYLCSVPFYRYSASIVCTREKERELSSWSCFWNSSLQINNLKYILLLMVVVMVLRLLLFEFMSIHVLFFFLGWYGVSTRCYCHFHWWTWWVIFCQVSRWWVFSSLHLCSNSRPFSNAYKNWPHLHTLISIFFVRLLSNGKVIYLWLFIHIIIFLLSLPSTSF